MRMIQSILKISNGKRRRGERIDKPSGTTYRPSDPNDPRERELQDND